MVVGSDSPQSLIVEAVAAMWDEPWFGLVPKLRERDVPMSWNQNGSRGHGATREAWSCKVCPTLRMGQRCERLEFP